MTGRGKLGPLPNGLDESAIHAIDAAARTQSFDDRLLDTAAAEDMRRGIEEFAGLLRAFEERSPGRKRGWIARYMGADVEEQLRFELAVQAVERKFEELKATAAGAWRFFGVLQDAESRINCEQDEFDRLIEHGRAILAADAGEADARIRARFERRLANLIALSTANTLTLKQLDIAQDIIRTLLDRFTDIETTVFPLWQRQAFALLNTVPGRDAGIQQQFGTVTHTLLRHLGKEPVR